MVFLKSYSGGQSLTDATAQLCGGISKSRPLIWANESGQCAKTLMDPHLITITSAVSLWPLLSVSRCPQAVLEIDAQLTALSTQR